jgi:oleandomycin transport system ATP-binding protein
VVDHGRVIAEGTPDELKARTGAQTLTVRPASPDDLPTLINIVGTLTLTQPEVRGTAVTAPVTDPGLAPAVVRRLDDAGVRLAELTLRGSTLDEVFLSLTGSRTEEPQEAMA